MADASYDAVIIGGGTKSIVTAIYLAKYGGMSVGVFEERRELCSGLTSEQSTVPGFVSDYHATQIPPWAYMTVKEDFPDFEDKGGKIVVSPATVGGIVQEDQSCWVIYNRELDPNQERTAKGLAQFSSQRDAETYLKLWELTKPGTDFYLASLQELFNPPLLPGDPTPSPLEKWFANYLAQPDCLIDHSWKVLPALNAFPRLWERPAVSYIWLRYIIASGRLIEMVPAVDLFGRVGTLPDTGYIKGGTHSVAHAYQRILLENGGKWYSRCEVDKIIIENGKAKGIRLTDGTQIEAKKLIVSGVDPYQLCFRLIGKDQISDRILRKVDSLQQDIFGIAWYGWFLHELPKYTAAKFNSGIDQCGAVVLASDNLKILSDEVCWLRLGKIPPIHGLMFLHHHSIADKTRSPEGKHVVLEDAPLPTVSFLKEREWLDLKKAHAKEAIDEWRKFAPNMTWDNVIGFAPQTPYDVAGRGLNFSRSGNPGVIDIYPGQTGRFSPIVEMAQYRMPIKNLYATGTWHSAGGSTSNQGYACYKSIAEDLGLRKPWAEKGRPY